MESRTKTRFAPSPTGRLHLGNVRTALFNALLARRDQGVFLLRFEDTDPERCTPAFAAAMEEDLHWLGLDWDEGPQVGGAHGPYFQAQRAALYEDYFARLQQAGQAYPCFCSREELAVVRKSQRAAGQAPRYAGTCARLGPAEVEARRAAGLPASLRFRVPADERIAFDDLVRGPQEFAAQDIGDFIIRRSNGTPAFFFSNAVDDALMGVTHVLRGEDHLTNTPRQILLLQALGLRIPRYGHTAMIVGADGGPLSKRHGSHSVAELRAEGFLPGAVLNYLARLGHHYAEPGYVDLAGLSAGFAVEQLGKAPAKYEQQQLLYWQKEALRRADDDEVWGWLCAGAAALEDLVPASQAAAFVQAVRDNVVLPGDGLDWAQRLFSEPLEYAEDVAPWLRDGAGVLQAALAQLEAGGATAGFKDFARSVGTASAAKGKALFMPLRAALTGCSHGPDMSGLWPLLGRERIQRRLLAAVQRFNP